MRRRSFGGFVVDYLIKRSRISHPFLFSFVIVCMFSTNCMIHWCNILLCFCGSCCIPFLLLPLWTMYLLFAHLYSCVLYFSQSINYYWHSMVRVYVSFSNVNVWLSFCSMLVFRAFSCCCVIADVNFVSDYCDRIPSGWRRSSFCLKPTRNSMRRYIAWHNTYSTSPPYSVVQKLQIQYVMVKQLLYKRIVLGMGC